MTRKSVSHVAFALAAAILSSNSAARGVTIEVGSDTVPAGETVTIEVKLNTMGQAVAGTDNRIGFDPETAIIACRRNPAIRKESTSFVFSPDNCRRANQSSDERPVCDEVRALVLSLGQQSAIPDGAVLYSCDVQVASDAPLMTFPLPCSDAASGTPGGQPVETDCAAGEIVVEAPNPPTPTPTGGGGGGGGCSVAAPASSGFAWMLLGPAALMALRRRRR